MKLPKKILYGGCLIVALLATTAPLSVARPDPGQNPSGTHMAQTGRALAPQPSTVDQITHDMANIVTTVDNWGYVGGYDYYGYPSGEWLRNSGHNYLAEVRYWMGAVTASGDTLVANSYDDFQALPMPIDGEDQYQIYLSTDPERYHQYDQSDEVGADYGRPAHGWRVWSAEENDYVYNDADPLPASFNPAGPVSLQDSHYRFADNARGEPLLGLELTHSLYSWNYCYNEDFLFVVLEITNTSDVDYAEFAFGLYLDIDVGGPDGTGENGRLHDMVAFDSTENLAWIYDAVGYDPGWKAKTGIMGTKYLETPGGGGMTSFRSDDWSIVTGLDDGGRFQLIASDQFDESLPPTDQFYIQCTRGIELNAGETKRVVYALIAGQDEEDFRNNAALAQQLYDNNFVGPQPPATPVLTSRAGDGKVYLYWSDTSEVSVDPLSGLQDFAGYKLYRSDNQGKSWGEKDYKIDNNCMEFDYDYIADYSVDHPGGLIQHSFVDSGLINGVEYWYCLVAYDSPDPTTGVDALQTGFGIAGQAPNVVSVRPEANPAGYYEAAATVSHQYTGSDQPSPGTVTPIVFDRTQLLGADYEVVFEDAPEATYWHLISVTTGDTVLDHQTLTNGDPELFPIAEGLRVYVTNGDVEPEDFGQTGFGGADTTLSLDYWWGPTLVALTGDPEAVFGHAAYRNNYELRYTGDSTRAFWVLEYWYGFDIEFWVPFEVWNTSTNARVSLAVYDNDENDAWDPYDELTIVDYPYNPDENLTEVAFPYYYGWMFVFDATTYNPTVGDVFSIEGAPLNGPDDRFVFKVDGINAAQAKDELANVKVVPNPYYARYSRVETQEGESVLKFINLPGECTIRIYTLAGELVSTIDHTDGSGEDEWNLLSANHLQVASGMYFYHIESPYGERLGRFAVIK
ncbi:MAG: T9SS type A sorting domain-containing protein [bacterium]